MAKPQLRKSAAVAERRPSAPTKGSAAKAVAQRRPALRAPLPAAAAVQLEGRTRGITTWFRDIRSEMRKVVWPTREQATKLTAITIVISIAVGLFLGGADALFSHLVTWFLR